METCTGCGAKFDPATTANFSQNELTTGENVTTQFFCTPCTEQIQEFVVGLKK